MTELSMSKPSTSLSLPGLLRINALPLAILLVFFLFGLVQDRVWSIANISNIVVQASYLAIFAMAQTIVILTRGFDLSLGHSISFVSVACAMIMVSGVGGEASAVLGIVAALAIASLIGLANGVLVAGIGINPLVTTLGMANVILALASTVSGGFPVADLPSGFTLALAQGTLAGIPAPVVIAGLVFFALLLMLRRTRFGRSLYIIGANPKAATAAGIRSVPVLTMAYGLCGLLVGIGALMLTARTGSGEPNLGGNLTLESIAAAVVGGVRLSGGEGGVGAAVAGAVFITVLSNGMNLIQIDGYLQQICLGAIIIVSLIVGRQDVRR